MIAPEARTAHDGLSPRLRPFIARRVAPADVDDVLQDVFVRVQRGLGSLRDDDRFGPWVYQVTRSVIAEHRRTRQRHPLAEGEAPDLPEESSEASIDGSAETELVACVVPFIAMLPSRYREALTLTELQGLSQREAADMSGISLSGMKSRVQRGREMLRGLFDDCCAVAIDARGHVMDFEPKARPSCPPGGCGCG